MKVEVVPYDLEWTPRYEEESEVLKNILGPELVAIHHIGSTSVPRLAAKPIIDIMPVVKNIEKIDSLYPLFEKAGYECMGEFGIPGRRYFRKGGECRTHQVHVFEEKDIFNIERAFGREGLFALAPLRWLQNTGQSNGNWPWNTRMI